MTEHFELYGGGKTPMSTHQKYLSMAIHLNEVEWAILRECSQSNIDRNKAAAARTVELGGHASLARLRGMSYDELTLYVVNKFDKIILNIAEDRGIQSRAEAFSDPRCEEVGPSSGQCVLSPDHEGQHRTRVLMEETWGRKVLSDG